MTPDNAFLIFLFFSSHVFRRRLLSPPRVGPGKLYLAPLPVDGSESSHLPNTIVLQRVSSAQTAPIMLPLAHGSARLGLARPTELNINSLDSRGATPAPLAVNRRGRRPPPGPWRLPVSHRRHSDTWVYPSAETPLAPHGHWEGPSSEPDFFFEPFAERSDRQPSGKQPATSSGHRLRKPNNQRAREPFALRKRKPTGRKNKKPTSSKFPDPRRAQTSSSPHTSVRVGASVQYPGTVSSVSVTSGNNDVIYDAAVDPQRSASRMTPGVGFRLPPSSVEYGGWKPISA